MKREFEPTEGSVDEALAPLPPTVRGNLITNDINIYRNALLTSVKKSEDPESVIQYAEYVRYISDDEFAAFGTPIPPRFFKTCFVTRFPATGVATGTEKHIVQKVVLFCPDLTPSLYGNWCRKNAKRRANVTVPVKALSGTTTKHRFLYIPKFDGNVVVHQYTPPASDDEEEDGWGETNPITDSGIDIDYARAHVYWPERSDPNMAMNFFYRPDIGSATSEDREVVPQMLKMQADTSYVEMRDPTWWEARGGLREWCKYFLYVLLIVVAAVLVCVSLLWVRSEFLRANESQAILQGFVSDQAHEIERLRKEKDRKERELSEMIHNQTEREKLIDFLEEETEIDRGIFPSLWPRPQDATILGDQGCFPALWPRITEEVMHAPDEFIANLADAIYQHFQKKAPTGLVYYTTFEEVATWRTKTAVAILFFSIAYFLLYVILVTYVGVRFYAYKKIYTREVELKPAEQEIRGVNLVVKEDKIVAIVGKPGHTHEFVTKMTNLFAADPKQVPSFVLRLVLTNGSECGHAVYTRDFRGRTFVLLPHHVWQHGADHTVNKFLIMHRTGNKGLPLENFLDIVPVRGYRFMREDRQRGLDVVQLDFLSPEAERDFKCQLAISEPVECFPGIPKGNKEISVFWSTCNTDCTKTGWVHSAGVLSRDPRNKFFQYHTAATMNGSSGTPILMKVGNKYQLLGIHTGFEKDVNGNPVNNISSSIYPFNMRPEFKTIDQIYTYKLESAMGGPSSEDENSRNHSEHVSQEDVFQGVGFSDFRRGTRDINFSNIDPKAEEQERKDFEEYHTKKFGFHAFESAISGNDMPEGNRLGSTSTLEHKLSVLLQPNFNLNTLNLSKLETSTSSVLVIPINPEAQTKQKGKEELSLQSNPVNSKLASSSETVSPASLIPQKEQKLKKKVSKGKPSNARSRGKARPKE